MKLYNTAISNVYKLALFCSFIFVACACSENEAQQEFEDKALQPPSGIMAMNANGNHPGGSESDSSDWKIAHDFIGRIRIETAAFPNPVAFNSTFEIQINVIGIDAIDGLFIYALQQPGKINTISSLRQIDGILQPGLQSFVISPQEFAQGQGTGTIGNTWRIILFNRQQKVISYGDVLIGKVECANCSTSIVAINGQVGNPTYIKTLN